MSLAVGPRCWYPTQAASTSAKREKLHLDVQDRLDILNVIARYTHAADEGDTDAIGALFSDEGMFIGLGADPGQALRLRGRDELPAFIRKGFETGDTMSIHFQTATEFLALTPESGRTRTRAILGSSPRDGAPTAFAAGTYYDTFTKVEGRWLIQERVMRLDASALDNTPRPINR